MELFNGYISHTVRASEAKPIRSTCQGSTAFISAPPEKLVPLINATAVAKCQFVQPAPEGFLSAPPDGKGSLSSSEIEYSLLQLDSLVMIARSSLPASFIISSLCPFSLSLFLSLFPPQLNELFRKSEVHKDFMSVRVRNLAPSNSILAFVEAHFKPGERSLKRA